VKQVARSFVPLFFLGFTLVDPRGAMAQTVECIRPSQPSVACALAPTGLQPLVIRVLDGLKAPLVGIPVTVTAIPGGAVVGRAITDALGLASVSYAGNPATAGVTISAAVTVGGQPFQATTVVVKARTIDSIANVHQAWYVERQLPGAIQVHLSPDTEAECLASTVRFRALTDGSIAAPDTARGFWETQAKSGRWWEFKRKPLPPHCVASGRWRLGKENGEQFMRVDLLGGASLFRTVSTRARALPRVMGGLSLNVFGVPQNSRLSVDSTIVKVTRTFAGGQTVSDSVVKNYEIDSATAHRFSPILGVDWSPWLPWGRVRMIVGTNPTNAANEWVFGVSALQFLFGPQRESVGYDVQLVSDWRRRDVISNLDTCRGTLPTCTTRKTKLNLSGVALLFTVDGTYLIKDLITAFPLF
jgi:hypothetical protein